MTDTNEPSGASPGSGLSVVVRLRGVCACGRGIGLEKTMLFPSLLPVGTAIFPQIDSGDIDLEVKSYSFDEKTGRISCWTEEVSLGGRKEEEEEWLMGNGWNR